MFVFACFIIAMLIARYILPVVGDGIYVLRCEMAQIQTTEDSSISTVGFSTVANSELFKYNDELYFKMNEVIRTGVTRNAWKWPNGTFHTFQGSDQVIAFGTVLVKAE